MTSKPAGSKGDTVLELGRIAAEALVEQSPDSLDQLDTYIDAFSAWEAEWKGGADSNRPVPNPEREIAERIAAQHNQILRLAGELRFEVGDTLKSMHVKGKGLKTYIDQLPQQISTIKKKG